METFTSDADLGSLIVKAPIVIIDIFSQWCPPCKQLAPILEQLDKELDQKEVRIIKVDVTEGAPQFVKDMGIKMVPTLLYFKDSELKLKETGFKNKEGLLANIESVKK
jgi:thioredoxin 1